MTYLELHYDDFFYGLYRERPSLKFQSIQFSLLFFCASNRTAPPPFEKNTRHQNMSATPMPNKYAHRQSSITVIEPFVYKNNINGMPINDIVNYMPRRYILSAFDITFSDRIDA